MNGKLYKLIEQSFEKYLIVFPTGDYFFNMPSHDDLTVIFNGEILNSKNHYKEIVCQRKYKLKYLGRTTAFIINNPELFI